jgi:hypothetical protein
MFVDWRRSLSYYLFLFRRVLPMTQRESISAVAEPPSNIAPSGGAKFHLDKETIIPYVEPRHMGLLSPTGGKDLIFFLRSRESD